MDPRYLADSVERHFLRMTGKNYPDLWAHLEKLPAEAILDFERLARDVEYKLNDAERTFRPFPGGPRIKF